MEYIKDFENWNNKKKSIESNTYMPYFDIGEIWWCSLGRSISSKRLIEKIQKIEINQLLSIQKAVIEYNFPLQLFEILPPKDGEQPEGQHSN